MLIKIKCANKTYVKILLLSAIINFFSDRNFFGTGVPLWIFNIATVIIVYLEWPNQRSRSNTKNRPVPVWQRRIEICPSSSHLQGSRRQIRSHLLLLIDFDSQLLSSPGVKTSYPTTSPAPGRIRPLAPPNSRSQDFIAFNTHERSIGNASLREFEYVFRHSLLVDNQERSAW